MSSKILIVDDERGIRTTLCDIFTDEGFEVDAVSSGERCLEVVRTNDYDLILLDIWLGEMDGLSVLSQLKKIKHPAYIIMISGHGTIENAVTATRLGAWDFIEKPLSLEKTVLCAKNALRQRKLEIENQELIQKLSRKEVMIGESSAMKQLRHQIELAAPTESRVLIRGEHGTGKELVARAIHQKSSRAHKTFVEVNCAAIPEELIESELFGHIKGSFTGATEDKTGKFKNASGGTIFLDEIGDMSLKTQAKVLRALQEQTIEPVGGNRTIEVDVRVIAATNKNLEQEIDTGAFRSDLFFRINVLPITVPSLKERKEDIPLLTKHFMAEFAAKFGWKPKEILDDALQVLKTHSWPGNVRELRNVIERLMIMVEEEKITVAQLKGYVPLGEKAPVASEEKVRTDYDSLREAREAFEKQYIMARLNENQNNIAETAKALKVERSHFYRKLKSFGITPEKRNQST